MLLLAASAVDVRADALGVSWLVCRNRRVCNGSASKGIWRWNSGILTCEFYFGWASGFAAFGCVGVSAYFLNHCFLLFCAVNAARSSAFGRPEQFLFL